MNTLARFFVLFIANLLVNISDSQAQQKIKANSKPVSFSKYIEDEITNQIIKHYQNLYRNGVMSRTVSDSVIEISFQHKPDRDDKEEYWMLLTSIPRLKKHYISGPLYTSSNNIVCSVNTEGGGGGGNISWNDIFVFQLRGDKYKLVSYVNSPKICGCKEGNFYPVSIEFGRIVGTSNCLAENDPYCCPSLNYKSIVKLDKDKLVFVSKTKIEGNMK